MTPEGKVKAKVKAMLKEAGAYQHWPVQTGYGAPALDCHACLRGFYIAIETKAPGKKPTKRQEITCREIETAGGTVFIVDGSEESLNRLQEFLAKVVLACKR